MIRLAIAQPGTAVLSFDLCCATPVLPVATGRQCSPPPRLLPREAINAPRQQAASVQIPIASDAQLRHTSRGFLLWRFAYADPTCPPHHHHGAAIRKPSQKQPCREPPIMRWRRVSDTPVHFARLADYQKPHAVGSNLPSPTCAAQARDVRRARSGNRGRAACRGPQARSPASRRHRRHRRATPA
jgi:hypothetical protein